MQSKGELMKKEKKPKKGYWYKFWIEECVLCGRYTEGKYRMYTHKPKDVMDRYERTETACYGHFL